VAVDDEAVDTGSHRLLGASQRRHDVEDGEAGVLEHGGVLVG
jgi:hypothetical protein